MNLQDDVSQYSADREAVRQLIDNLTGLRQLHRHNLLGNLQERQQDIMEPVIEGELKIPSPGDWLEYLADAGERSLLFWDTLRKRADNTLAHEQAGSPPLLKFDYEVLLDGADLEIPVNYSLLRILPGQDQPIDETLAPVIVIDPRGGHGAGIGGFKQDSEIGESLRAGHPTYFIAFGYSPEPGQTMIDVAMAQMRFIELVTARHPKAGKPVVIGNCQAGWALMGLAAARPELPGLVIVNGAPLAYWAGENGSNPMRYAGGLMGGAWATRLASDLGNGRFDGAWLVSNFEDLNPSHALWSKDYDLYANVDTEAPRFLDFERWWGSPNLFNAEEIEAIVDDLFIGNRLAGATSGSGNLLDLRAVEAPVVVFCSYGDNITPPQQALDWIADLYPDDLALQSAGRTIVYLKHASTGHLGIFVSGRVARREHRQMINAIDEIKALPPGLYELIIDEVPNGDASEYQVHFESRSVDDIRALDSDDHDEDREFIEVDRVSEVTSNLYGWMVRPWLSRAINEPMAEALRKLHPFRLKRSLWGSQNPFLWWLPGAAEQARETRHPVSPQNPLLAWQDLASRNIVNTLDTWRDIRDASNETKFHAIYGYLSLLSGTTRSPTEKRRDESEERERIERLKDTLPEGGELEAGLRVLLLFAKAEGKLSKSVLETVVQGYRKAATHLPDIATIREITRQQNLLVFAYPEESLQQLPNLVPEAEARQRILDTIPRIEPAWCNGEGDTGKLWRQLQELFEQPSQDSASKGSVSKGKVLKAT
ncbi:DUF3141 domain-containing protein [Pistricoccus aurantiacus]|uniref:DUF3141 domain-containing protein n=1 Tax=Pistricoccus aurantiacus TaxID=1883414 RepID=UPI00363DDC37